MSALIDIAIGAAAVAGVVALLEVKLWLQAKLSPTAANPFESASEQAVESIEAPPPAVEHLSPAEPVDHAPGREHVQGRV
jgi:hypothetical protein